MTIMIECDMHGRSLVRQREIDAGWLEASWKEYVWNPGTLFPITARELRVIADRLDVLTAEREARERVASNTKGT